MEFQSKSSQIPEASFGVSFLIRVLQIVFILGSSIKDFTGPHPLVDTRPKMIQGHPKSAKRG